ncbi:hypothetical protein [uncultured Methylobacterium sp.]|jgi:hypothetical protein|nr:hypothetical protein [uncultured Methylobacterium sp.]
MDRAASAHANRPGASRLGRRVLAELKRMAAIFAYLWTVFGILVLHEWIVLSRHGIDYRFYGLAFVNSWILAKVVLVTEHFDVLPRWVGRPPIYRIVTRSIGLALILVAAYALEETVIGLVRGRSLADSLPMVGGGVHGYLAISVIMAVALVPYFTVRELGRVLGRERLRALILSEPAPPSRLGEEDR